MSKKLSEIEKVKDFLVKLGFECISTPQAENLIYKKQGETVLIKNNKH